MNNETTTETPAAEIDPATGLPRLPDGMRWNIQANVIAIERFVPAGEWGTSPLLWDYEIRDTEISAKVRRWWGGYVTRTETRTEYRNKEYYAEVFSVKYGKWEWGAYCSLPRGNDPVTPENLLERTTDVLKRYNAKTRLTKIYGTYPPKKFEGA